MARTKAKLVRVKKTREVTDDGGNVTTIVTGFEMVMKKIPFTTKEEAARDVEEAAWAAAAPARELDEKIQAEVEELQKEERADLRQRAEQRLRQRGEIT